MESESGERFDVAIPAFSLDSPDAKGPENGSSGYTPRPGSGGRA